MVVSCGKWRSQGADLLIKAREFVCRKNLSIYLLSPAKIAHHTKNVRRFVTIFSHAPIYSNKKSRGLNRLGYQLSISAFMQPTMEQFLKEVGDIVAPKDDDDDEEALIHPYGECWSPVSIIFQCRTISHIIVSKYHKNRTIRKGSSTTRCPNLSRFHTRSWTPP